MFCTHAIAPLKFSEAVFDLQGTRLCFGDHCAGNGSLDKHFSFGTNLACVCDNTGQSNNEEPRALTSGAGLRIQLGSLVLVGGSFTGRGLISDTATACCHGSTRSASFRLPAIPFCSMDVSKEEISVNRL